MAYNPTTEVLNRAQELFQRKVYGKRINYANESADVQRAYTELINQPENRRQLGGAVGGGTARVGGSNPISVNIVPGGMSVVPKDYNPQSPKQSSPRSQAISRTGNLQSQVPTRDKDHGEGNTAQERFSDPNQYFKGTADLRQQIQEQQTRQRFQSTETGAFVPLKRANQAFSREFQNLGVTDERLGSIGRGVSQLPLLGISTAVGFLPESQTRSRLQSAISISRQGESGIITGGLKTIRDKPVTLAALYGIGQAVGALSAIGESAIVSSAGRFGISSALGTAKAIRAGKIVTGVGFAGPTAYDIGLAYTTSDSPSQFGETIGKQVPYGLAVAGGFSRGRSRAIGLSRELFGDNVYTSSGRIKVGSKEFRQEILKGNLMNERGATVFGKEFQVSNLFTPAQRSAIIEYRQIQNIRSTQALKNPFLTSTQFSEAGISTTLSKSDITGLSKQISGMTGRPLTESESLVRSSSIFKQRSSVSNPLERASPRQFESFVLRASEQTDTGSRAIGFQFDIRKGGRRVKNLRLISEVGQGENILTSSFTKTRTVRGQPTRFRLSDLRVTRISPGAQEGVFSFETRNVLTNRQLSRLQRPTYTYNQLREFGRVNIPEQRIPELFDLAGSARRTQSGGLRLSQGKFVSDVGGIKIEDPRKSIFGTKGFSIPELPQDINLRFNQELRTRPPPKQTTSASISSLENNQQLINRQIFQSAVSTIKTPELKLPSVRSQAFTSPKSIFEGTGLYERSDFTLSSFTRLGGTLFSRNRIQSSINTRSDLLSLNNQLQSNAQLFNFRTPQAFDISSIGQFQTPQIGTRQRQLPIQRSGITTQSPPIIPPAITIPRTPSESPPIFPTLRFDTLIPEQRIPRYRPQLYLDFGGSGLGSSKRQRGRYTASLTSVIFDIRSSRRPTKLLGGYSPFVPRAILVPGKRKRGRPRKKR